MPSIAHEAPLVILREAPELVPTLLRRSLGVALPPFASVEVSDADLTQAVPAELRADLVLHLRDASGATTMGLVVEIQRRKDEAKRWSWPLYVAALHARLRAPAALVVIAANPGVARWSARPVASFQAGSPFVPLVLGPDQVPIVSVDDAHAEPWLGVLAGLVHGDRAVRNRRGAPTGSAGVIPAAAAAIASLPVHLAAVCYDLLWAALSQAARIALEDQMPLHKYEPFSPFARQHFGAGLEQGREEGLEQGRLAATREVVLTLAERHGAVRADLRARVATCTDAAELRALTLDLAAAIDAVAVAALLARLPAADR